MEGDPEAPGHHVVALDGNQVPRHVLEHVDVALGVEYFQLSAKEEREEDRLQEHGDLAAEG
eukprot:14304629-Alexandrium_andersonii.AAC.1